MVEVRQTEVFAHWLESLRDERAQARIKVRIRRVSLGNLGEVKPVGEGVSELRVDYGHGYRIYLCQRGARLVVLLCGGDKKSQAGDIKAAKAMARDLED